MRKAVCVGDEREGSVLGMCLTVGQIEISSQIMCRADKRQSPLPFVYCFFFHWGEIHAVHKRDESTTM